MLTPKCVNVRRLIVDAGLRVGALSNNIFPIYVGVHLNVTASGANPTIPK